jgi:beta-carotene/zeaxanthin 4-ketolase
LRLESGYSIEAKMLQLTLGFEFFPTRRNGLNICDSQSASERNRSLLCAVEIDRVDNEQKTVKGLVVALLIISLWGVSLISLLNIDVATFPTWLISIAIVWQIFLYTGLFITAHDAMHGSVFQQNKKINHAIGSLVVWLYGFFSYRELLKKHWLHHQHPASELDPDFHDGEKKNGILWYLHFMKRYWSWNRFIWLTIAYNLATLVLNISLINLVLFWIVPPILSSIQLFYFGTYLPHRQPKEGYVRPHCAQTIVLPIFWSFVTCYHFGYHREHHEYPHLSWWQLPKVYKQRLLVSH